MNTELLEENIKKRAERDLLEVWDKLSDFLDFLNDGWNKPEVKIELGGKLYSVDKYIDKYVLPRYEQNVARRMMSKISWWWRVKNWVSKYIKP